MMVTRLFSFTKKYPKSKFFLTRICLFAILASQAVLPRYRQVNLSFCHQGKSSCRFAILQKLLWKFHNSIILLLLKIGVQIENQNIHGSGTEFKHADALSMGNAWMHWCRNLILNLPSSKNREIGGPRSRYHKLLLYPFPYFLCSLFPRLPLRKGLYEINLLKLHDWLRTDNARTGPWRAISFSVS